MGGLWLGGDAPAASSACALGRAAAVPTPTHPLHHSPPHRPIPPRPQSVGRKNVCYDNFLSAATFSDAVFLAPPGSDRFVLENVDGFAWQMRLKSMVGGTAVRAAGAPAWAAMRMAGWSAQLWCRG